MFKGFEDYSLSDLNVGSRSTGITRLGESLFHRDLEVEWRDLRTERRKINEVVKRLLKFVYERDKVDRKSRIPFHTFR